MKRSAIMLGLLLALFIGGCGPEEEKPQARDFDRDTMGYYCSMALVEHVGPKGQIHVAGEPGPLWFSSVRDAFAFYQLEGATRRIRAFYVNDMSQDDWQKPGPWIDGEQARYVVGSRRQSSMGEAEIIPFADPVAAQNFAHRQGGRVVVFGEVRVAEVLKGSPL